MNDKIVAVGPILPPSLAEAIIAAIDGESSTKLADYLETLIQLKVSGIILYGSAVRLADSTQIRRSDVDLLVLVDEPAAGGVFGSAAGLDVDLHVQHRERAMADFAANWIFSEGRVLFDSQHPVLKTWLDDLHTWKIDNANPWSAADRLRSRVWAQRLVSKVKRLSVADKAIACLHEARLLAELPTLYAQHHCERTTSIGSWWMQIQERDHSLSSSVRDYLALRSTLPDAERLEKLIVEVLFNDERVTTNL